MADSFKGHTDYVLSVAYSPDRRHIVSGSRDNTIRVWDATTGQAVAGSFQGHTDDVISVVYSPDGRHIVSGSQDEIIRVWDICNSLPGCGGSIPGAYKFCCVCYLFS